MKTFKPISNILLILLLLVVPLLSFGGNNSVINSNLLFKVGLPAPSLVTSCNHFFYVYSYTKESVYKVDPMKGDITPFLELASFSFDDQNTATSLSCFKNEPLLVLNSKQNHLNKIIYKGKVLTLPSSLLLKEGFFHSSFSMNEHLFLLSKLDLYSTSDFKSFKKWPLPPSSSLMKVSDVSKEANPFVDWQNNLMINSGLYSGGFFSDTKTLYLLDTLRSSVVLSNSFNEKESDWDANFKPENFKKWGKWGSKEGTLLSPRGFALLQDNGNKGNNENKEVMAISDSSLKIVSLFTTDGIYLGKIEKCST